MHNILYKIKRQQLLRNFNGMCLKENKCWVFMINIFLVISSNLIVLV